jgi:hypothetical protein
VQDSGKALRREGAPASQSEQFPERRGRAEQPGGQAAGAQPAIREELIEVDGEVFIRGVGDHANRGRWDAAFAAELSNDGRFHLDGIGSGLVPKAPLFGRGNDDARGAMEPAGDGSGGPEDGIELMIARVEENGVVAVGRVESAGKAAAQDQRRACAFENSADAAFSLGMADPGEQGASVASLVFLEWPRLLTDCEADKDRLESTLLAVDHPSHPSQEVRCVLTATACDLRTSLPRSCSSVLRSELS